MSNADQQIYALAKHVSQSTAVLKHMGEVLEIEKANCSKELLRDIRKIKHSCKRTFKEINSTTKSKRFRFLVSVRWLFKRTKAMELEARLDSQQSMLQCIIHTLSVSKLGRMDSRYVITRLIAQEPSNITRSKQDSEHIIGLKVEIKLLKTFIMESYNNLTELRQAEQSTEAEEQYQSMSRGNIHPATHHPYGNGNIILPNPIGGSSGHGPPIMRSPSHASRVSESENEDFNSGGEADDDDDDDNNDNDEDETNNDNRKFKDQNDQDGTKFTGDTATEEGLVSKLSFRPRSSLVDELGSTIHRESNLLLQLVPYRPRPFHQINSDRLISYRQGPESSIKHSTQEATNSVRLLLDKWTNSGSAPVSNILDEEAAKEKSEVSVGRPPFLLKLH